MHPIRTPAAAFLTGALMLALAAPALALPGPSGDTPKGRLVVEFYEMIFRDHKIQEAFDTYVGDDYIQHNPRVPTGIQGAITGLGGFLKAFPNLHAEIKRVFVDGDFVILHVHSKLKPEDRGRAIVDIFRLENGKVVEHWDVIQDIPEKMAHENTMF